ncbi:hypothetical protein TNCV_4072311 [Trichonephila clavipes]|uniref:Uncharacterized protein n=1 Tax=Trichonephila clavipes TaxID=2585209 RepID=A0A8X6W7T5_TRICX|nr:hypothetical protein TNCV_4072311 [Trichonephila clavipes]
MLYFTVTNTSLWFSTIQPIISIISKDISEKSPSLKNPKKVRTRMKTLLLAFFDPSQEQMTIEDTLSVFENFLRLETPQEFLLMEYRFLIYHIFSYLLVKIFPLSSTLPSGDDSNIPTHKLPSLSRVLLVGPLGPNADSSTIRNFPSVEQQVPFKMTRIQNINNGGIAVCLTIDEDVSKLIQE